MDVKSFKQLLILAYTWLSYWMSHETGTIDWDTGYRMGSYHSWLAGEIDLSSLGMVEIHESQSTRPQA
jgi:hypothetical protein